MSLGTNCGRAILIVSLLTLTVRVRRLIVGVVHADELDERHLPMPRLLLEVELQDGLAG
jgi:hypothetical protein